MNLISNKTHRALSLKKRRNSQKAVEATEVTLKVVANIIVI